MKYEVMSNNNQSCNLESKGNQDGKENSNTISIYFKALAPCNFINHPVKIIKYRNLMIEKLCFQVFTILYGLLSCYLINEKLIMIALLSNISFIGLAAIGFHGIASSNYTTITINCLLSLIVSFAYILLFTIIIFTSTMTNYKCNFSSVLLSTLPFYYHFYLGIQTYLYMKVLLKAKVKRKRPETMLRESITLPF